MPGLHPIFTSAADRIHARWQSVQNELKTSVSIPTGAHADNWLAPVFLDERAAAYVGPRTTEKDSSTDKSPEAPFCNPIRAARISNKGFLPMTRDQYLALLDTLGRVVRAGKRGSIPANLPPILDRLDVEPESWLDSLLALFGIQPQPPPAGSG